MNTQIIKHLLKWLNICHLRLELLVCYLKDKRPFKLDIMQIAS